MVVLSIIICRSRRRSNLVGREAAKSSAELITRMFLLFLAAENTNDF